MSFTTLKVRIQTRICVWRVELHLFYTNLLIRGDMKTALWNAKKDRTIMNPYWNIFTLYLGAYEDLNHSMLPEVSQSETWSKVAFMEFNEFDDSYHLSPNNLFCVVGNDLKNQQDVGTTTKHRIQFSGAETQGKAVRTSFHFPHRQTLEKPFPRIRS